MNIDLTSLHTLTIAAYAISAATCLLVVGYVCSAPNEMSTTNTQTQTQISSREIDQLTNLANNSVREHTRSGNALEQSTDLIGEMAQRLSRYDSQANADVIEAARRVTVENVNLAHRLSEKIYLLQYKISKINSVPTGARTTVENSIPEVGNQASGFSFSLWDGIVFLTKPIVTFGNFISSFFSGS